MSRKRVQKDRPLPLKAPRKEGVFMRKDSRFYQARYFDPAGKLHRRSTGTTLAASAREWLATAKRQPNPVSEIPPPNRAEQLSFFSSES